MDTPLTKEQAAYAAIRGAVIAGELNPGQAVTIREMAAKFSLGRTPICDAMKRLAFEGWLTSTPGVGTQVASLNLPDRYEYMQVRGALEILSARLCAERITMEMALEFDHCLAVAQLAIDSGNLIRAIEADIAFHQLCAQQCGNKVLLRDYSRLLVQDELVFFRNVTNEDARLQSHQQHGEIASAIRAGDATRAETAARTHTMTILSRLKDEQEA